MIHYETKVLYKKDSVGRIRIWHAKLQEDDDDGEVTVVTHSGIDGGTIKTHHSKVKATATMGKILAGESKVKSSETSKLKDTYFETREEAEAYAPNKAMLLHRWDKYSQKITYPCFVQPKLDGVCAIYVDDPADPHFKSRENNRFEKLDHMAKELWNHLTIVNGNDRKQMDSHGELYAHGRLVSEIVEAIKGSNTTILEELEFYIFDYMDAKADKRTYQQRMKGGSTYYRWSKESKPYVAIRTLLAKSAADIDPLYEMFIRQDFEGMVICNFDGPYQYDGRSYNKLKKKNLFSKEFEIIATRSEEQEGLSMIMFRCATEDGVEFAVRPAWDHAKRSMAYKESVSGDTSFLGKMATVEYRSITKYGTPFHPVLVAVRDYE